MSAMKTKLKNLILISLVSLLTFSVGCSGGSNSTSDSYEPGEEAQVAEAPASEEYYEDSPEADESDGGSNTAQPAKIIVEANIELETKNFNRDTNAVKNIAADGKSYFESTNLTTNVYNEEEYRVFYATLKVPAEDYERVKEIVKGIGNLKRLNETTEDVSGRYYDSQTRLETKKIEENRVLALIEQAENVEDILELERQLADIRLEMEMHTDNISNIDRLTAYSSIYLEVTEVNDYSLKYISAGFGSRVLEGLNKSFHITVSIFEGVAVFFAGLIVPAILIIALAAVVFGLFKSLGKLKPKRK